MQAFPTYLHVDSKLNLSNCRYNWALKELRKAISLHMLQYDYTDSNHEVHSTENNYFNISEFYDSIGIKCEEEREDLYKEVEKELVNIGWKCKLSFGKSAMFIYSSDKVPSSCWEDEF